MKTLNFNKKSFHYKLAGFMNDFFDPAEDICAYTRQVIFGFLRLIAVICLGTLVIIIVGRPLIDAILGLVFSIYYGVWMVSSDGVAGLIVYGFCLLLGGIIYIRHITKDWRRARASVVSEDNFITHAYSSFKDKFCVKINFN